MCPATSELISSYADGSGSFGALFDVVALDDVTLRGIDLNVDWHTDDEADVQAGRLRGRRDDDGQAHERDGPEGGFRAASDGGGGDVGANADLRYTVGTNVGSTVSANPQLRILEGAGAANYPPFRSGTPEGGNVDYTYYAPRVFNGRLHYDHVRECPTDEPSGAPSAAPSSAAPTASPRVETTVSYAFYVEHDPDQSGELVVYDMTDGTRKVLARLVSGMDAVLTGYAEDDGLDVVSVATRVITPREIGCEFESVRFSPRFFFDEFPHALDRRAIRHLRPHPAPGMLACIRGRGGHSQQDRLVERRHVRAPQALDVPAPPDRRGDEDRVRGGARRRDRVEGDAQPCPRPEDGGGRDGLLRGGRPRLPVRTGVGRIRRERRRRHPLGDGERPDHRPPGDGPGLLGRTTRQRRAQAPRRQHERRRHPGPGEVHPAPRARLRADDRGQHQRERPAARGAAQEAVPVGQGGGRVRPRGPRRGQLVLRGGRGREGRGDQEAARERDRGRRGGVGRAQHSRGLPRRDDPRPVLGLLPQAQTARGHLQVEVGGAAPERDRRGGGLGPPWHRREVETTV
ncbi:hypothetical protein THAOC_32822 [Thalassiosira oceanica]|uniref:Uncharacterized protein n=1 Tax=Thalassiosira oceanica TaxID=159749 RepID=K0R557_THAOC|nr:hypothetical protein THAOC_32822 [Thalassiosira oceanica]|eukprot:EJK48383.1 hypothetical protein THAOC_32822 [Thalassiosira oceanica]